MQRNTTTTKLKVNLAEAKQVTQAVLAAAPTTEAELDATLSSINATGPLLGRCYRDETAYLRPRLFDALILPRLCAGNQSMRIA